MSLNKLQRRTFLTALGLGVAAPLAFKMSRLAVAAPTGAPVRLLNIFIPHGIPWDFASPFKDDGSLDLMAKGADGVFAPFQPHAELVNVIRGSGMATGANNHTAIKTVLTGSGAGAADSFDFQIAQQLKVKPFTLGAVPFKAGEFTVDSQLIKHGGQWVRAQPSPIAAADELFFGLGGGGQGEVDEAAFRAETINLSMRQVEELAKKVQGLTSEENKLKQHLDALAGMKQDTGSKMITCTDRPVLDLVEATRTMDPLDPTKFGHVFKAQLQNAGTAMLCGTASVLTLQALHVNSDLIFSFEDGPGLSGGHHNGLSHGNRDEFAQAQNWFMKTIAEVLLPILAQDDPAAPGSSVLDNSIVHICSEISDPKNHNSDAGETWGTGTTQGASNGTLYTTLPQVLIGGAAGQFKKGGNVINVDENRQHTDVLATIGKVMGAPLPDIGDAPTKIVEEMLA